MFDLIKQTFSYGQVKRRRNILEHLIVNRLLEGREVGLHVDFCALFNRFKQTERLIKRGARDGATVQCPDEDAVFIELISRCKADFGIAADHPREETDTVREDDNALGAGAEDGAGEFALIPRVNVGHGDGVCGVGVHDDTLVRVLREAGTVCAEVHDDFAGEAAALRVTPHEVVHPKTTASGEHAGKNLV